MNEKVLKKQIIFLTFVYVFISISVLSPFMTVEGANKIIGYILLGILTIGYLVLLIITIIKNKKTKF